MTRETVEIMRAEAFYYKSLVKLGAVTKEAARTKIEPWLKVFNEVAKEKAEKFGIKVRSVSYNTFIRY